MARILTVATALACSVAAFGDYILDREAAMKLVKARKHKEAKAAFLKMADGKVSDFQKSDALEQAVSCALRLKEYAEATKLAKRIPLEPVSKFCRMTILSRQRKRRELIEQFKNEDFSKWPDYVAGSAYRVRGSAFSAVRDGKRAAEDLTKALTYPLNPRLRPRTVVMLGSVYANLLKDDAKALAVYREALQSRGIYDRCRAATPMASILQRQKKLDEAVALLRKIDPKKIGSPHWRRNMLCALADALAKAGKPAEAVAKYEEALKTKGISARQKASIEKAIKGLRAK